MADQPDEPADRADTAPIDLSETYIHLKAETATPFAVTPSFWRELMTGNATSLGARKVLGGGWLMTGGRSTQTMGHWEQHPAGEEILVLVEGHMGVALEEGDGVRIVELDTPGATCVVPRGVWHRQLVRAPSYLVALTYGEGTAHRPAKAGDPE